MSHHAPEDGRPPTMTDGTAETTERTANTSEATPPDIHPAADDPYALLAVNRVQKHFPIKQGIPVPATGRSGQGRRRRVLLGSSAARRSVWWVSPAAASRRPAG